MVLWITLITFADEKCDIKQNSSVYGYQKRQIPETSN